MGDTVKIGRLPSVKTAKYKKPSAPPFLPAEAIWVVYVDGIPLIWCLSKAKAEKYRNWGRRKMKKSIRIREYRMVGWEKVLMEKWNYETAKKLFPTRRKR